MRPVRVSLVSEMATSHRKSARHLLLTWRVDDFLLCLSEASSPFLSAHFQAARESTTDWRLDLFTDCSLDGNRVLRVDLLRASGHPEPLGVSARLMLDTSDHVTICSGVFEHSFTVGSCRTTVFEPQTISQHLERSREGALIVRCEMFLLERASRPCDRHLCRLADDLIRMYETEFQTNLSITIRDGRCSVHKEIVLTRCPTLVERLGGGDDGLDFGHFDRQTVDALVRFLYSGEVWSDPPPIGLYDCALELGVSDLVAALEPRRVQIVTAFTGTVATYLKCSFPFPRRDPQSFLRVYQKIQDMEDAELSLRLSLNRGVCFLQGEIKGILTPCNLLVELSLLGADDAVLEVNRAVVGSNASFRFPLRQLEHSEGKDQVSFHCSIVTRSNHQNSSQVLAEVNPAALWYNRLPQDMVRLLQRRDGGDQLLSYSDKWVSYLSYMVGFRAQALADLIARPYLRTDEEFGFVKNLLFYLHSGTFYTADFGSLRPLLILDFPLSHLLHQRCLELLHRVPIHSGNVVEIYAVAKGYGQRDLIRWCERILLLCADSVMSSVRWKDFKRDNPQLAERMRLSTAPQDSNSHSSPSRSSDLPDTRGH